MAEQEPVQNVTFPSNGGEAHGYLALPPGGTGPGLIVIQEWWGLTTHMADMTNRFATAGFVALAPDLYGGKTTHDAEEASGLMQALPADRAARDLGGAVDFLLGHEAVTGDKVGAVGFCMGGGFVLPSDSPDLGAMKAAVLGQYGAEDAFVPKEAVDQTMAAIATATGTAPEVHFYPAGHAFLNDENLLGTYDAEQAKIAWERAVEFLHAHLG
jgi:carboxymethylenebutenolidase